MNEIKALNYLLYLAEVLKTGRLNFEELWDSVKGVEPFRLTMKIENYSLDELSY